jgi:uncharacterized protein
VDARSTLLLAAFASLVGLWLLCWKHRSGILNFLLMNAAVLGWAGAVRLLLSRGADANATDRTYMAVQTVDEDGSILSSEPPRQHLTTVLMGATSAGQVEVMEVLVEYGARVNATDADGRTALMVATIMDHPDVAQALLTWGAEVNARDADGRTALGWARHLDRPDVIPVLERAGARE